MIETVGAWGQRWIETEASLKNLDPNLLMWDIRRNIDPAPMPRRRSTIEVILADQPAARRNWWLIVQPGKEVDLCSVDPGFDVDLYLATDLRTMTEIWMGYTPIAQAKREGRLTITGSRELETTMKSWLTLSPFAKFLSASPESSLVVEQRRARELVPYFVSAPNTIAAPPNSTTASRIAVCTWIGSRVDEGLGQERARKRHDADQQRERDRLRRHRAGHAEHDEP